MQVNIKNSSIDLSGPTVENQVAGDAFDKVINSDACTDMIVIETTTLDPNTRFWCVHELITAMNKQQEKPDQFKLHYLFSKKFLTTYVTKQVPVSSTSKWKQCNADGKLCLLVNGQDSDDL